MNIVLISFAKLQAVYLLQKLPKMIQMQAHHRHASCFVPHPIAGYNSIVELWSIWPHDENTKCFDSDVTTIHVGPEGNMAELPYLDLDKSSTDHAGMGMEGRKVARLNTCDAS